MQRENRKYAKTVAEVLLLTATQNVAQRGHTESANIVGVNIGNFCKILHMVVRHDEILTKRFFI